MKHIAASFQALIIALPVVGMCAQSARAEGAPDIAWMSGGHGGMVESLALSPDGQLFASASPGDYTVKLWNPSTGQLVRTITVANTSVHAVAFSPDGQYLATGQDWLPGWSDPVLKLWRVSDGAFITPYDKGAFYNVHCLAFSPDGTMIAAGCDDFNVRLFDTASGALLHTMSGHNWFVFSVAFSPDGQTVASASGDNTAKLWSVATGGLLHTLTGHTFFVSSVDFLPDGSTLATGSWDHTIRLWNVSTGANIKTLTGPAETAVYAIDVSPDGQFIAAGGSEPDDNAILRIWQIATSSVVQTMPGHLAAVNDVQYTSDGATLMSGGADSLSKFWNVSTGALIRKIGVKRGGLNDVEFSPDGAIFAAANDLDEAEIGGDIELLDSASGAILRNCIGHTDVVNAIAFSHNGQKIASASGSPPPDTTDQTVRVWNVADASQLLVLAGHVGGSTSVAVSMDNQFIASGGRDQKVRIWNSVSGALVNTISAHNGGVTALAFSPDGLLLASASDEAKIKLWSVPSWSLVRTINTDSGVSSIDFSSDSQNIVAGLDAYGDNVRMYRVSDGALLHTFAGDPIGFVQSVDLSPDNSTIISASGYSFVIQLWDIASETLVTSYDRETGWGPNPTLPVAFSPDGALLGYGRGDATIVMAHQGAPLCDAPDINCDGVVNAADLLMVINNWGPCPSKGECAADISPAPNGDGVVNAADLLMVINNWG